MNASERFLTFVGLYGMSFYVAHHLSPTFWSGVVAYLVASVLYATITNPWSTT